MAIKKIQEVKNLGIFIDYKADATLPDFKQYNLIYGWNGSGKTTLSELFNAFPSGQSKKYPSLKYKIITSDGEYDESNGIIQNVRVFNQNFIDNNIDIDECKANPIFIIGEENKKTADLIKQDEMILKGNPENPDDIGKIKELENKKKELASSETSKGEIFTNVAKTISTTFSGVSARNYRKNDAEKDFELLTKKDLLSNGEVNALLVKLKQQEMNEIDILQCAFSEPEFEKIYEDAKALLQKTVDVVIIERLKENHEIAKWVEDGFYLHKKNSSNVCEFCNQPLTENRMSELALFFNEADKKIKDDIDFLILRIEKFLKSVLAIKIADKANLYIEMKADYSDKEKLLELSRQTIISEISDFKENVNSKKSHTTEPVQLNSKINLQDFNNSILEINTVIKLHNQKTKNFLHQKNEAQEKLKTHFLSEKYDSIKKLSADIVKYKQDIEILENGDPNNPEILGIKAIQRKILENRNKISSSGLACDEINRQLETFLGRKELLFECTNDGYIIKRNGVIARNLSEGEKTAIAFVYFTIQLTDRDFNPKSDIIVVDDPISSFDSNSLFQAFSFLKNSINYCSQVFIFTHNFDFLQLIINWLSSSLKNKTQYFMIKNLIANGVRTAKIDKLDKLLIEYSSEYQYLFKIIYDFAPDGTLDSVYHIPNIARKVLDSFLLIMIPNNDKILAKLNQIPFDEMKKTAIYKFTNDQSHITGKGFDPSLVSEAQNVIAYLKEMMKTVFPSHYDVLEKSVVESKN